MGIKTYKVPPPPSGTQLTGGADNNSAEPAWKNWFSLMYDVMDRRGYVESPDGSFDYMHYSGNWSPRAYRKNEVVVSMPWTMVCINDTEDPPAPQPQGPAEESPAASPSWSNPNFVGEVQTWHEYTFTTGGWLTKLEYYIPEVGPEITYRVVAIDNTDPDNPQLVTNELINPESVGYYIKGLGSQGVPINSKFTFGLISFNAGAASDWNAGWTRGTDSNTGAPAVGQWNRRTQNDVVRIHHTDLDNIGRQGQLEGVAPGSTIQFVNTDDNTESVIYYVLSTTPQAAHVEYGVLQESTGVGGEPPTGAQCNMTATTPAPQATQYVENVGYWTGNQPSFGTVQGLLYHDGVPVAGTENNAYGIRITFQPGVASPDWGFLAYSEI